MASRAARRAAASLLILLAGDPIAIAASDYFGQVTFNGIPVPGVSVTAAQGERKTTVTTDQDGIYHLSDLADGVWDLTIEMLGFFPVKQEIKLPDQKGAGPLELATRPFDDVIRENGSGSSLNAGRSGREIVTDTAAESGVIASFFDPTGIGATDGLLINGSMNNGASTPFALPRGLGNNRPRPRSSLRYTAGFQLGNSAWDAHPFSLTGLDPPRPSYADLQANGTVGGQVRLPWLRSAVNLFVGYQGGSTTSANMQSARVPTVRERAGDFSQSVNALGQPVIVVDPVTGEPFAGNVIPPDRISPQALALLEYYPRAGNPGSGRFNYESPQLTAARQSGIQSSASYQLDNLNQISGAFSFQRTATTTTNMFQFEDDRDTTALTTQAEWQHRKSRHTTIRARYQYTRGSSELLPYFANRINVSGQAGITGNAQDPLNWGPTTLTFASDLAGLNDGRYSSSVSNTHLAAGEIARFKGSHSITAGGDVRWLSNELVGQADPRGSFGFTGAASGSDFGDFLLGFPHTSSIGLDNPGQHFRNRSYAAFIADDWRISASLTLNLGLRWEYETPVTESAGRMANLDVAPGFAAVHPVLPGQMGTLSGTTYPDALLYPDRTGIEPRLGLAWRPRVGSSIVVRAGYGVYRTTNVYLPVATLLGQQPPFSTTFNVTSDPANPLTLANGFTTAVDPPPFGTFAVDPNMRVPTAHNWQASIQRDLVGASVTVTATYLGAKGTNLMQQFLPNTYPAGADNPCLTCPAGFRYLVTGGRSIRHAGQIQVRRRLSTGLAMAVDYTLSTSRDNATAFDGATLGAGSLAQNWLDLEAEYSRSNFDQRHLMTASVEYTTGVGTAGGTLLDGWKGALVKDWTMTANLSAGSGLPLTPVYFVPIGGTGVIGSLRPDVTGVNNDPVPGSYANAAAFAAPTAGQWGNAPRNAIIGPGTFLLNASVLRTFRIGNRLSFDWRLDASNVLNVVTYASVNTLITSPQFGLPNRANDMRRLRTSVRVRF